MKINLTEEQLHYIYEFDRTHSITTACLLARTLVDQVIEEDAKEFNNGNR